GLISRDLFSAAPLHFLSDLRDDVDAVFSEGNAARLITASHLRARTLASITGQSGEAALLSKRACTHKSQSSRNRWLMSPLSPKAPTRSLAATKSPRSGTVSRSQTMLGFIQAAV